MTIWGETFNLITIRRLRRVLEEWLAVHEEYAGEPGEDGETWGLMADIVERLGSLDTGETPA